MIPRPDDFTLFKRHVKPQQFPVSASTKVSRAMDADHKRAANRAGISKAEYLRRALGEKIQRDAK